MGSHLFYMLTFFLIIKYNVFVDGSIVYKKITHTLSDDYVYVGVIIYCIYNYLNDYYLLYFYN